MREIRISVYKLNTNNWRRM